MFGTDLEGRAIFGGKGQAQANRESGAENNSNSKAVTFAGNEGFVGTPAKQQSENLNPPPTPSFQSPNSKGFEMTPIKSSSSRPNPASSQKKSGRKRKSSTPHSSRQTHFFTSPEAAKNTAGFMSPQGPLSPLAEMR